MAVAEQTAKPVSFPVPTGGLNTRLPLYNTPAGYALILENIFPHEDRVALRSGSAVHFGPCVGAAPIGTLAVLAEKNGTQTMLAASDGSIYNVSTSTTDAVAIAAAELDSGFTSDLWQTLIMSHVLILLNGEDTPQQWNGTALTDAVYTGPAAPAALIQGTTYRNRIYLVEKNTSSVWYGGVLAITGALTEFDFGAEFSRGGELCFVTTMNRSSGVASTQTFLAMSTMGELLLYQGEYPGTDTWNLVSRVMLDPPLGRRAFLQRDGDVEICTSTGVISVQDAINGIVDPAGSSSTLANIAPTISTAARYYGDNAGWEMIRYPRGKMVILNVPVREYAEAVQYVRNAISGAWCRFTGWPAVTFTVFNNDLYFGLPTGVIYKADTGQADGEADIPWEIKTAFNSMGGPSVNKLVGLFRPLVITDGSFAALVAIDFDYERTPLTNTVSIVGPSGSAWDVATWDLAEWAEESLVNSWYTINGAGRTLAIHIKGAASNVTFSIYDFQLTLTSGGVL